MMTAIKNEVDNVSVSASLQSALGAKNQGRMRGYLSEPASALRSNGTIAEIRVTELEALIGKCNVVLIEADDMKSIQFKIVYRNVEKQLWGCAPDRVIEEHILMAFTIYPKEFKKRKNAAIAANQRMKK